MAFEYDQVRATQKVAEANRDIAKALNRIAEALEAANESKHITVGIPD